MSFEQPFTDPIINQIRKGTPDDPYLDIYEEVYVDQSKATLTEIPYKYDRVQILEQTGGAGGTDNVDGGTFTDSTKNGSETIIFPIMYEIDNGAVIANNQYIVDYTQGVLTFNASQNGAKFLVHYTGRGFHYYPSSRIVYKQNLDGTITTLQQVLDSSASTIANIETATQEATTAANNANSATTDFQNLLNQQLVIYKTSVANFAAIATTYPTPQLGWTVTEKQYGIQYRYDGTSWKEIGTSQAGNGFNVYVGNSAPANPNILWLNVPNENRMSRIVKSSTAPADTSVIWWES
jgi:hypothetical protein